MDRQLAVGLKLTSGCLISYNSGPYRYTVLICAGNSAGTTAVYLAPSVVRYFSHRYDSLEEATKAFENVKAEVIGNLDSVCEFLEQNG
jgi:hypothetical protein